MARLFEDGFDHYGDNEAFMLDGVYAQAGCELSTDYVATGVRSVKLTGESFQSFAGLRKVLPAAKTTLGIAARIYCPTLQPVNNYFVPFEFLSNSPSFSQVSVFLDGNGALQFVRGNDYSFSGGIGDLITQTDPVITAAAWNHVEIQINFHDTTGWIRVAVNGVEVFEQTGLDTLATGTSCHSIGFGNSTWGSGGSSASRMYMDDLYIYDFEGDPLAETDFCPAVDGDGVATEFIGDLQCMWLAPNGDTSEADWAKSTGAVGYDMINEVPPVDADYIISTAVDDLSEFDFEDLPEEITYIRGVTIWGRLSKSDAGAAHVSQGMKSFATVLDATQRPVTVAPTYWRDMANIDPNTGAATGTLTFTGQPGNTETVVIDGKTYTFETVLTNVDGHVLIGATLAASIANLQDAINLGAGSGVDYAAATTLHSTVAAVGTATTLVVTAKAPGTGGNAIATTETVANASWGAATLTGGDAGGRWTRATLNNAQLRLTRAI